jgi:large subunit ribosomal protein L14e
MYEIGRICIKLAGRDAGGEAVIIDILDDKYVLIDGNVRRRKCNIMHLEPTAKKIEIKKKAGHEEIKQAFTELGFKVWETKPRKEGEKPKRIRHKAAPAEKVEEKTVKKKVKKESKTKTTEKKEAKKEEKAVKKKKPSKKELAA